MPSDRFRIWANAGVEHRHAVVDPRVEDLSQVSTGARMRRFVEEAMPLAKTAVDDCLANAGLSAEEVDQLTVVSCTGYATPGVDLLLARDLAMPATVQRLHIGHMGCYAALPALAGVADAAVARGKTGIVVCVELPSLHIQPPSDDLDQIVGHALFSDGIVAAAVVPGAPGLEILSIASFTDASSAEYLAWDVTDRGFRMRLSSRVPALLDAHVGTVTLDLLERHGLRVPDVDHWAIHPGGPGIVTTVARRLGLTDDAVAASRDVLRFHGNCSSGTILLVLDQLLRERSPSSGELVVAMAFGPGLTLYAALLRFR